MAQQTITWQEQKKINEINTTLPFKTTNTVNFDGSINTGFAEKVNWDSSISLGTPTGVAKTKSDAMDERTLSGNSWDKIDIKKALGNK